MNLPAARDGGRAPLTVDRIVDCAVALAKAEGMAGVSLRKVARGLGVETMSLYHHVPGKAALMLLMADRSLAQLPQPDPAWPWDRQLVELLVHIFQAAVDNPAVFPVLASEPLHPGIVPLTSRGGGAASLGLLERVLALLAAGNVPADVQVHVFRGLLGLVIGFTVGQVDGLLPATSSTEPPDDGQRRRQLPLLTGLRPALAAAPAVDGLRFSLQLMLQGLTAPPHTGQSPSVNPVLRQEHRAVTP